MPPSTDLPLWPFHRALFEDVLFRSVELECVHPDIEHLCVEEC